MRALAVSVTLALLLLGRSAAGADSDCPTTYRSGEWLIVECFLCDGDHSATDCAELDLETEAKGIPVFWVAELNAVTGCTNPGGPTVHVRGLSQALGTPHIYASLTTGGTSAVREGDPLVTPPTNPRHRHLDADVDITTSADCSDVEVLIRLFYWRDTP